jgi:hypothetical protein
VPAGRMRETPLFGREHSRRAIEFHTEFASRTLAHRRSLTRLRHPLPEGEGQSRARTAQREHTLTNQNTKYLRRSFKQFLANSAPQVFLKKETLQRYPSPSGRRCRRRMRERPQPPSNLHHQARCALQPQLALNRSQLALKRIKLLRLFLKNGNLRLLLLHHCRQALYRRQRHAIGINTGDAFIALAHAK